MSAQPGTRTWVLILAGGAGTRFWPASTRQSPKQVLPLLDGGRSLLQATIDRVIRLVPAERVHVVSAADQRDILPPHCQGLPAANLLWEPVARNTAPAIAMGMVALSRRGAGPHDAVIVLSADAWIADEDAFRACLRRGVFAARQHKSIVTVGIEPDRPATGYGYLELGEPVAVDGGGDTPVLEVKRFHEKPDLATAEGYLAGGKHLWNAGIFVFRLGYLWYVIGDLQPDMDVQMTLLLACLEDGDQRGFAEEYAKLPRLSIDHAVMEQAPSVLAVRGDFGWSDVGSWHTVGQLFEQRPGGQIRAKRDVQIDARGNVVYAPGRTVALLGVEDLVVVVTDGEVLVAPRERAEEVKAIVAAVEELDA